MEHWTPMNSSIGPSLQNVTRHTPPSSTELADRGEEKERDAGRATGSRVIFLAPHRGIADAPKKVKQGREPPAFYNPNTIPAPSSPRRSGHLYASPPPTPQNYAQPGAAVALPPTDGLSDQLRRDTALPRRSM